MDIQTKARKNLEALATKSYTGRGLVLGTTPNGEYLVQVYWLTGRSLNSRNRVLLADCGKVWTEAADPSKVEDPSLIIYTAMNERDGAYVVSNGAQTDWLMEFITTGHPFDHMMRDWDFGPDAPNFTPRITGITELLSASQTASQKISILRRNSNGSCQRSMEFYTKDLILCGFGQCVTTYTGEDTNPLPSFVGSSYPVPILDKMGEVTEMFRKLLDNEHFISLAVKFIDRTSGESEVRIVNRYKQL
jgi:hypothetical protein